MEKIALQLQPRHKAIINALKRGKVVEIIHHGQVLGVASPINRPSTDLEQREKAMADFFGMRKRLPAEAIEDEARSLRRGRNKRHDDL